MAGRSDLVPGLLPCRQTAGLQQVGGRDGAWGAHTAGQAWMVLLQPPPPPATPSGAPGLVAAELPPARACARARTKMYAHAHTHVHTRIPPPQGSGPGLRALPAHLFGRRALPGPHADQRRGAEGVQPEAVGRDGAVQVGRGVVGAGGGVCMCGGGGGGGGRVRGDAREGGGRLDCGGWVVEQCAGARVGAWGRGKEGGEGGEEGEQLPVSNVAWPW